MSAATSMVTAPSEVGVNVAVYTVVEVALNELKAPLVTVISPKAKKVVASLDVNVSDRVASSDVNPSAPSAAVITIVGPNRSFKVIGPLVSADDATPWGSKKASA